MSAVTPEALAERCPEIASSLSSAQLELLLDAFELHDAAPGEALVAEGTSSSDLFLVWEGQLDVTQSAAAGTERRLARLGPGSWFGEVSLLDPGPASATVGTEQGCVVLRLDRARFDELRGAEPAVAAALLEEALRVLGARIARAGALLGGAVEVGTAA